VATDECNEKQRKRGECVHGSSIEWMAYVLATAMPGREVNDAVQTNGSSCQTDGQTGLS